LIRIISLAGASGARHRTRSSPAADLIVLDTLGKLYAHGHGIGGYCLTCQRVSSVSLPALIMERGVVFIANRSRAAHCR
jgi:hypothetical protein